MIGTNAFLFDVKILVTGAVMTIVYVFSDESFEYGYIKFVWY
jgi:hypothetical protein